jgi:cobalamin biosynthesis Mg chelatase CobN
MKRQIVTIAAVLVLAFAGAAFAQSSQNTTAPGPTTQQEPGLTNNNLPNPGNPQTQVGNQNQPVEEHGTVEGTATENLNQEQAPAPSATTTTTTETTAPTTETTTGTTLNNDQTTTTTETTTGTYSGSTDTSADTATLPSTASDLPSVALIGLLALGAAFAVRVFSKRNA